MLVGIVRREAFLNLVQQPFEDPAFCFLRIKILCADCERLINQVKNEPAQVNPGITDVK